MLSWICPKCGTDVPPAYSECPKCAAEAADTTVRSGAPAPPAQKAAPPPPPTPAMREEPAPPPPPRWEPPPAPEARQPETRPEQPRWDQPSQTATQPPPAPVYQHPPPEPPRENSHFYPQGQPAPPPPGYQGSAPQYGAPPTGYYPPQYGQQPSYPPPPPAAGYEVAPEKKGLPPWLMTVLFMLAFAGVIAGAVYGIRYFRSSKPAFEPVAQETLESAGDESQVGGKPHPLQNQIEVGGFRVFETTNKKLDLQFVVINHSGVDIDNLGGTIRLVTKDKKGNITPFVTFPFKAGHVGPYEMKELKTTLTTNLRAYELPDWQFLESELRVTAP